MGSEQHACPVCGQPVETVVRRHKTLGAWVPTWVAGSCRNPRCEVSARGDAGTERPGRSAAPAPSAREARHTGPAREPDAGPGRGPARGPWAEH
ncbi:hypothetical protein [Streptomyces glaucescens]|uniref:Uncharacterized protein n=1 Tax=Streptomyces glaucescens TaxID=1907 RepID=A0A089XH40_STRGA|nr:hypothetical protein [Streptomyces glaucescens]AIS00475.1 hypothetical protein SGLAU_22625 [Streptomyces glaucescens]